MRKKESDDLAAVRTLVETLEKFDAPDQERIIRWVREKLGLPFVGKPTIIQSQPSPQTSVSMQHPTAGKPQDIKTFIGSKNPRNDVQFAATVAYYHRFEVPDEDRKDSLTANDLQEACRKARRERLKNPGQTLINAHKLGLLDKTGRGAYSINAVGENLVAMILPEGKKEMKQPRKKRRKKATKRARKKR